jgi:hypothetical protein
MAAWPQTTNEGITMKNPIYCVIAAALALLFGTAVAANPAAAPDLQVMREMVLARPAFAALSASDRQSMLGWIAINCAVGSTAPRARMRQTKGALDVAFAEAYLLGPTQVERLRLAQVQRAKYAAFVDRLRDLDSALFDAQTTAELQAISEDDYVETALNQQTLAFRSAALDGLSLTATRRVLPWLRRLEPTLQEEDARGRVQRLIRTVQVPPT